MQKSEVVLSVLRERGRRGLPLTQLYRQMFNKDLYLLAYGNIYSNQGAMTPGTGGETADGMSEEKIEEIAELMRRERACFLRRTMNRDSQTGRTGSAKDEGVTPRCGRYARPGAERHDLSRVISATASAASTRKYWSGY